MISWRTAQVAILLLAPLLFAQMIQGQITEFKLWWLLWVLAIATVADTLFVYWLVQVLLKREDAIRLAKDRVAQ